MSAERFAIAIQDILRDSQSSIMQGIVGKIESFDSETMRADVKPLLRRKNIYQEVASFPVLKSLPVGLIWCGDYCIKPDYKTGDKVWLSFATHDTEFALQGFESNASADLFNLQNATVSHGIKGEGETPATIAALPGLVLGEKTGKALIQIDQDTIKIQGGLIDNTEKTVLGETLKGFISDIISAFTDNASAVTAPVAIGTPAQLAPTVVTALEAVSAQIDNMLSNKVKIG